MVGVALAGGGPLGAIYEIGALLALDEALRGIDLTKCDVYVGVSSGSFFAAGLACGLSPFTMHRLFIESDKADDPFEPDVLLRLARGEYGRRITSLPRLLSTALADYVKAPFKPRIFESLQPILKALPLGLFDSAPLANYMQRLTRARGLTNDFRKLRHKLYIVATDLDTGETVTFGAKGFDEVPISRAIEASAALPGLFPPVKIGERYYVDGALQKTLHASAALKEGVKLLFAINPLVPFREAAPRKAGETASLAEEGLFPVLSQTFRSLIHSRMKAGMERYRHDYPDADIVIFEPPQDDREMFFANVFSYADRRRLCEHAYQQTRADLLRRASELEPILARHGVSIDKDVLLDKTRTLLAAREEPSITQALDKLDETLGRLDTLLAAAQGSAPSEECGCSYQNRSSWKQAGGMEKASAS
jgi:predicted acylesterase/phospholipase RssA